MADDNIVSFSTGAVATAALDGLCASPKTLPPSLFYDEEGCRLFYEITRLPEYYLTRSEFHLLETIAPEIADLCAPGTTLVEYGASDETKAAMLLRQRTRNGKRVFPAYVPIDVAGSALRDLRARMAGTYPDVTVLTVRADFMRPLTLPARMGESGVLGFFPGSTIGNLEPASATAFLRRARTTLGPQARLLLGFDTCRDPACLLPAYNDASGVTAAFNMNLLKRLNREAGAGFDLDAFEHKAIWNARESRIEMHLINHDGGGVHVAGHEILFEAGETIHTENSYKYAPDRMRAMVEAAGWSRQAVWSAPDDLFALWLLG